MKKKKRGENENEKKLKSEECREVRQSGTQGDKNKQNRAHRTPAQKVFNVLLVDGGGTVL